MPVAVDHVTVTVRAITHYVWHTCLAIEPHESYHRVSWANAANTYITPVRHYSCLRSPIWRHVRPVSISGPVWCLPIVAHRTFVAGEWTHVMCSSSWVGLKPAVTWLVRLRWVSVETLPWLGTPVATSRESTCRTRACISCLTVP